VDGFEYFEFDYHFAAFRLFVFFRRHWLFLSAAGHRQKIYVVYQASLWPGKRRPLFQGLRMLKHGFQRLAQILGDAEHHFAAGLHLALLQFRHIRTINTDTPSQMRL
jgi:hypothetical protein